MTAYAVGKERYMGKTYNFSSTLAALPEEVLLRAHEEFLDYKATGTSPFEIDPQGEEYARLLKRAESSLRVMMNIPQNYRIFFLHGNAESQFAAIPMNLLSGHKTADYIISGLSAKGAYIEAKKYGDIAIAASSGGATSIFSTVPFTERKSFRPDADYVHFCHNSRIYGTKFNYIPDTGSVPLVANMSSYLFTEPIDISPFALIYASLEDTLGISGLCIVILRDDLVSSASEATPTMLNYKLISENPANNPAPVWSLYMANLVFDWIISCGGLEEMMRRNERKASLLYDYLDGQSYYTTPVDKKCRSTTNVLFITGDAALDIKFSDEAAAEGLINLRGHKSIGGMCASLYNSMPYEGVVALVSFMKRFASENPKLDA